MKKLLATGATGLVGSRFVELYKEEYEVFNMDLTTGVDITDKDSLVKFISSHPADSLLHLAAFTDTNRAFVEKGDKNGLCYKVNVLGTQNLTEFCRDNHIHLIHISTDFVFDGQKTTPYTEEDPTSPIEWYGETKALAEQVVIEGGLSATILRLAYPYRAHYDLKPDLIKKIRAGLQAGTLYPQFTDTLITPTFIDDLAKVFAKTIEQKPQGIFHAVGSDSLSPYDLARKVAVVFGFDPKLVQEGSLTTYLESNPRPFARYAALSNAKLQSELGISLLTVDQGLAELKKQGA